LHNFKLTVQLLVRKPKNKKSAMPAAARAANVMRDINARDRSVVNVNRLETNGEDIAGDTRMMMRRAIRVRMIIRR
jgi:hypothetical protein